MAKKRENFYRVEKMRPEGSGWAPANGKSIREPVTPIGKIPPMPKPRKPRSK